MTQTEVLHKAVKGDSRSITKIVEQYTPLVHKIVNKYAWMSPTHAREDLVQEGLLGIVKAIETFDLTRGTRFMTWVYPQVRGAVQGVASIAARTPFTSGITSRPATITLAPASARPLAMPKPMPPLPPVTTATLPCRSNIFVVMLSPVAGDLEVPEATA